MATPDCPINKRSAPGATSGEVTHSVPVAWLDSNADSDAAAQTETADDDPAHGVR